MMSSANSSNLKQHNLESYYLDEVSADVSFSCGNDEIDGEPVSAQKCILGACSDYFDNMFHGSLPETQNPVRFPDATRYGLLTVFRYFYFNEFEQYMLSMDVIEEAIYLGKKFLIDKYVDACCRFLQHQESAEGILTAFELSIKYDLHELKQRTEMKIFSRHDDIFGSEDFLDISVDLLGHIVKSAYYAGKARRLLTAVLEWAERACKRSNIAPTMQNRRQLLNFMSDFEVAGMKRDELLECVQTLSGFFTKDEIQTVMFIIAARWPVPFAETKMEPCLIGTALTELQEMPKETTQELRFIPRTKILLGYVEISNLYVEDINKTPSICIQLKLVKIDDIGDTANEIVLLKELRTVKKTTAKTEASIDVIWLRLRLQEGIILEAGSVYAIRILILHDCYFYGCKLTGYQQRYVNLCVETRSDLIYSLTLQELSL